MDIHLHTQRLMQLAFDHHDIEQRCPLGGIDEQIQITALRIFAMQYRTKDTRIGGAVSSDDLMDSFLVLLAGFRWSHQYAP